MRIRPSMSNPAMSCDFSAPSAVSNEKQLMQYSLSRIVFFLNAPHLTIFNNIVAAKQRDARTCKTQSWQNCDKKSLRSKYHNFTTKLRNTLSVIGVGVSAVCNYFRLFKCTLGLKADMPKSTTNALLYPVLN